MNRIVQTDIGQYRVVDKGWGGTDIEFRQEGAPDFKLFAHCGDESTADYIIEACKAFETAPKESA